MPSRVPVEEIKRGCATLRELALQSGRDPSSVEVLAFGQAGQFRDRAAIEELEKAGVSRATIWLTQTAGDAAMAEMEAIARHVLPG